MKDLETRMTKTISVMEEDFAAVRAGRANPAVLNKITVDYYGTATPIPQLATVAVPEPRSITIQPWDASILKEIEKAIQTSDLGINPSNDGKLIRINFPPLTEERRKELVKGIHKRAEEGKVAIRAIRRDGMENYKKQEKNHEITEDDLKDLEKDLQELTDKFIKEIDKALAAKEKEIMEV